MAEESLRVIWTWSGFRSFVSKIQNSTGSRNVWPSPVELSLEVAMDPTEKGHCAGGVVPAGENKQNGNEERSLESVQRKVKEWARNAQWT